MKDMINSQGFNIGVKKNKILVFTYIIILLLLFTVTVPYAISEEQLISCSLSISDRSLGPNENANIEIICEGSPSSMTIVAYLDQGGICQYEYSATTCVEYGGLWNCRLAPPSGLPRLFYTDPESPCYNSPDAYVPREMCIYAFIDVNNGPDLYEFGDCFSGSGTDYITYEVPRIDSTTPIAYLNEPKTITISGAMFDGFPYPPTNTVEIDWDCPPTSSPNGLICNDASFTIDQTFTSDQISNQYNFRNFPVTHIYTGTTGYKYIGLRVYNRFAVKRTASIELDVRDRQNPPPPPPPPPPPICTNYCCQQGYSCTGSSIPGTTCTTTCCNIPCLPNCATLGGTGCSQGQLCQGGQFVDSGDYGTGSQAMCCVSGTCTQEPSLCTDYPGGFCCPEGTYCLGGDRQLSVGGCSSLTQCFTECTQPFQCVSDIQLCSESNLGTCSLTNKGEEKCADSSITCICDGDNWYLSQRCQDWCGNVNGLIGGGSRNLNVPKIENPENLRSEVQMCVLQQTFERRCIDSDEGKNPVATLGTCTQGNDVKVDEFVDDTHIKEWSCSVEHKCEDKIVECPPGKKALGGICVSKQDCIESVGSGIENDLACGVRFSSSGQLIVQKSYNNIIEVCEMDVIRPWLNNNVFNDANNGDTLLKELALKKYDNLANKIFDKTLSLYTSCQINSVAQCGDPNVPTASDLYRNPEIQECWLWSAALYSALRTAGIPGEKVFIGAYDFKDINNPSHPFIPAIGHELVIYDIDSLNPDLFTIMDITSAHARFPVQQWNQYRSDLDLCKAFYFDDAIGNTEWRGVNALSRIKPNIPYCADVCSDGTIGSQCSSFNGLICESNGVLQYDANQCGCPQSSDVWQSQIPGATRINCVCSQTLNNQQGHCISNGQQPLFCSRFIGNAPNRDQTSNVPVGLARYDCKGPDRIAGTQDDCGCSNGYTCIDSSTVGYVNADFGICVPL